MKINNLKNLRQDYLKQTLSKRSINKDPYLQFAFWFEEALKNDNVESNAMVLATVGSDSRPSARAVLLKGFDRGGFVFYSNYRSKKARQIIQNPYAALLFYWQNLERQIRIEGIIEKIDAADSDSYFSERPLGNKIGAWVSEQSKVIPNRKYLEDLKTQVEDKYGNNEILRPAYWGGFRLIPDLFEFWQGRADRLHDRIQYKKKDVSEWIIERLAP
jgi:pyridoxamine 5'-phosphate oxidase